jgi:hypothetical protein
MGVLRGFTTVILSILLFLSILAAGIFASVSLSLHYENVQPRIYTIASEIIETQIGVKEMVNQLMPYANVYCQTNTEVVQNFEGYTFVFPCSVVQEGYGSILNYSIDYLVKDFYYKEYNCSFVQCFKESNVPLFLISDYSRQFWKSLFVKLLIVSIVLFFLVFLIIENKSNAPILAGILAIVSSFIVLLLEKLGILLASTAVSSLSQSLSGDLVNTILSQVVAIFFSEASTVFLWMFFGGAALIVLGIIFKITGIGFKIGQKLEAITGKSLNEKNVSKSEIREIIKEEMSKKSAVKSKPNMKKKGLGNI